MAPSVPCPVEGYIHVLVGELQRELAKAQESLLKPPAD